MSSDLEKSGPQIQKRTLTPFLSKNIPHVPKEEERLPFPEHRVNIVSRIFFWWLVPLMNVGYKRTLEPDDLYYLTDEIKSDTLAERLTANLNRRMAAARAQHADACEAKGEESEFVVPKLLPMWALADTFKKQYFWACFYLFLANCGATVDPLLSKKLIRFVEERALGFPVHIGDGVGYAIAMSVIVLIQGILIHHYFNLAMATGAQAKAALTKAILDKAFLLDAQSRHKFPIGKITSLMGTDLARIDFALGFQGFLLTFPFTVALAIGLLIYNIGVSSLVGIGILIVYFFCLGPAAKLLMKYRDEATGFTDKRVNYIKEVLNNLKIIKYYSWENPYFESIASVRKKEMAAVFKMQVTRNMIIAGANSLPILTSLSTFLVLYRVGDNRDPASIFSSISLFNVLAQLVILVPLALNTAVDASYGLNRIGQYFAAHEIDTESTKVVATPEKAAEMEARGLSIDVDHASFEWDVFEDDDDESSKSDKSDVSSEKDEKDPDAEVQFNGLVDIDLNIKKGEFVVITGLIGSGKSSLLQALSGFMRRTEGTVSVNGSLILCGQPWIQNATVKENITFGHELDEKKYTDVVYACSLESDLDILPAGDNTEIGERGITLSGGQKARINLARAVYTDADIILLDDVLSAVDARVGRHIMDQCFQGLLKDKTRVLATHQLSLIGSADRVIFLNGDGSIDVGRLEELQASNAAFASLMAYNTETKEEEEEEDEVQEEKELIERQISKTQTHLVYSDDEAEHIDYNQNNTNDGVLVQKEERAVNRIKWSVYYNYIHFGAFFGLGSLGVVIPLLVLIILATFFSLFTNTWLSFWTEYKFDGRSDGFYIGLYVGFSVLAIIFVLWEFIYFAFVTNRSSKFLNINALKNILHTPMAYMDVTPMGRILNRFTKDTDVLDNEIGDQMRLFLYFLSNIIGVIILCIIYLPWFAIAVPFIFFIFFVIANFYQASAREIKRLEAIQRSFVYNNFNETLNGMQTIKAYGASSRFLDKNVYYLDRVNEAYYLTIANQRWLGIFLDIVAMVFVFVISFLCVFRVFKISAASAGLLLSYVILIAGQLSMLVRTFTEVENQMNSVERICQYAFDLPQEAAYNKSDTAPRPSWPEQGTVRFENASLAYRPGLPLVLKNINLDIKPSEKIGICGRTGAGKSSIMTALYRLAELHSGKIEIDGVDISTLGLQELRSKLSIIPQDPVLFKGSIRANLDPFGLASDKKLWDALRRAGLIELNRLDTVMQQTKAAGELHKFHLDQNVEDDGSNFSLGERQLIAFARALVRDSKILILDEATSSVDYETDGKIQATIVREFSQCTILCIAHRLKTILNYDRILVLDRGEVTEFDTPRALYESSKSIFRQMCDRSGITADDFA